LSEGGRQWTLTLVDEDSAALATMAEFAERLRQRIGSRVIVEQTTDRCAALKGADYVVVAVARKRWALWEQDYRIPLSHGFNHCLGENGGPGALFHTLRSLELILPICRDIEAICPKAMLLNFTNPEARVLHAIRHLTKVNAIGLCHGVFGVLRWIERKTGRKIDEFDVVSAGMNHFYCVQKVVDRASGRDVSAELVKAAVNDAESSALFRKMVETFGVLTFPSDDHIGEYVSFGSEFANGRWKYGQECRRVERVTASAERGDIELIAEGKKAVTDYWLRPSGELAVEIIGDIELDRGAMRAAVNVLNDQGYVENLPRTAVVEVPAMVDGGGVHPVSVGKICEPMAAIMRTHFAIHDLLTEAVRVRSKRLLLQALALDPNVNSLVRAEAMLEEMLALQSDFVGPGWL
jgi:alpha-galactosidase